VTLAEFGYSVILLRAFGFLAPKDCKIIWLSIILALSISDEGYSLSISDEGYS
jgi:hypothetical protein